MASKFFLKFFFVLMVALETNYYTLENYTYFFWLLSIMRTNREEGIISISSSNINQLIRGNVFILSNIFIFTRIIFITRVETILCLLLVIHILFNIQLLLLLSACLKSAKFRKRFNLIRRGNDKISEWKQSLWCEFFYVWEKVSSKQ